MRNFASLLLFFFASAAPVFSQSSEKPNIVYILADDLGYGDLSCLNPESKIQTPTIDRLASEGMILTDVHSGSAVCTPTRYGILTGRYAWRTRLKSGVLWGYSPPLIEEGRLTVASFLQEQGYRSAVIGKWHLGLGWHTTDGNPPSDRQDEPGIHVDFTKLIQKGPNAYGFDYFFGIPASLDMDPYVYMENDRVVELPTLTTETHKPGQPDFWRGGKIAPGFKHIEVLEKLTEKAVGFIEDHVQNHPARPFFLYFPLPAPHAPVLPNLAFQGKSQAGTYGDFVVEVDWTVEQVLQALARLDIAGNTLVLFTSDNGPERFMLRRKEEYNHYSAHFYRGMKRDVWEGGHRVPFIARWPGNIKAGTQSDETLCLTDLMATVADILDIALPENTGEDSYSMLPALLGQPLEDPLREATVHHSSQGEFAIRHGPWKLCLTPNSGGNRYPEGPNAPGPDDPPMQLYNLVEDPGETRNLYDWHPEIVARLSSLLERYKTSGRSTKR